MAPPIDKKSPHKSNSYHQAFIDILYEGLLEYNLQEYFFNNEGEKLNAKQIYEAPFALLAHNKQLSPPIFCYGNRKALELFEYDWEEFVQLPSRKSTQKDEQTKREKLLKEVKNKKFIKNYNGIRISKSRKLFEIKKVLLWNSTNQKYQAALIKNWNYL